MRRARILLALAGAALCASAAAQFRWVDEKGRVQYSDTPPPPTAKGVQKREFGGGPVAAPQRPFALDEATRNFPVVLYTAPSCKEGCQQARELLNRRGVPFREVQVWNEETNEELKKVSGANQVPVLLVGNLVQRGFAASAFNTALDSAGYPRAGVLPARKQPAPGLPEGFDPEAAPPKPEPVKPETAK